VSTVRAADFGPLVLLTDIDEAILGTLATWLPTYLARHEQEQGWDLRTIHRPTTMWNALEDDEFPDAVLPCVMATTARPQGDVMHLANVTVSSVVRGRSPIEARLVASIYGGAVQRIMTQQDVGIARQVMWTGGPGVSPVATSTGETRHLAASINTFTVSVDDVLQGAPAGPVMPSPDEPSTPYAPPDPVGDPDTPYGPLVDATSMTVDVTGVSVTQKPGG
jgi:hypothetical protein